MLPADAPTAAEDLVRAWLPTLLTPGVFYSTCLTKNNGRREDRVEADALHSGHGESLHYPAALHAFKYYTHRYNCTTLLAGFQDTLNLYAPRETWVA